MKIAINRCYGGFSLSEKAYKYLGIPWDGYGFAYRDEENRTDPYLVKCIETLGDDASGACAELKVVDIPDDVKWEIEEYDGLEWVSEEHRSWY